MFGRKLTNSDELIPTHKFWHRHKSGKRVLTTIIERNGNYVKVNYDRHAERHQTWFNIADERQLHRFSSYEYIDTESVSNEEEFRAEERVNIWIDFPNENMGWKSAQIIRASKNKPLQLLCEYSERDSVDPLYYVQCQRSK